MRYLVDTSSLSYAFRDDSLRLRTLIRNLGLDQLAVSVMSVLEIEFGLEQRRVRRAPAIREFLSQFEAIPFGTEDARLAARLRATIAARGETVGLMDTLIAAQALTRDLTLLTQDLAEFSRIPSLRVIAL